MYAKQPKRWMESRARQIETRLHMTDWLNSPGSKPLSKTRVEECRERAEICRLSAESAQSAFDEAAWLDLSDDWMTLAEAFEQENSPKWMN
jgi:hypothetical protein